ncbi:hypothetical protein KCU88_g6533, partial [Aureobasidium melanogenum]
MRCDRNANPGKKGRGGRRANRANAMSISYLLNDNKRKQPPRDKYDQEEAMFIWYHRIDLALPWSRVQQAFQQQFHEQRGKAGLQCKFYRILTSHHIEKVRAQRTPGEKRRPEDRAEWGVIAQTPYRYAWMLPLHRYQPPNPKRKQ